MTAAVSTVAAAREVWGYRFQPVTKDPYVHSRLDVLFHGLPVTTEPAAALDIDCDGRHLADRLIQLVSAVNLAAIDAAAGCLLLHAGAVSAADGATAVVCGRSGSGKTTLTVRLAESGLHYVTDEAVCLEPATMAVRSYRKPAVIKAGSQEVLSHLRPADWPDEAPWLVPPSRFESVAAPEPPLSPALLLFPTYSAEQRLVVESIDEATAAYLLASDSSRLQDVRGGALPALARLARRAPAYRILHSDAVQAAAVVRELLAVA